MNIGVIFAGGVGKRMNSRVKPKQFSERLWQTDYHSYIGSI